MPRVATATASTGEGNAAAASSERPTPEAQQQPLPPPGTTTSNADLETSTDAGSNAGGSGGYGELDPLAQQELEAFGAEAEHDTLPRPPRDPNAFAGAAAAAAAAAAANSAAGGGAGGAATPKSTSAGAGPGSGNKRSLAATAEPLARAKRPKSVKISPAKMGKQFARRAVVSGAPAEYSLPNHDYCDSCGGKGQFLCCEGGCLRSFHFTCLDPPLDLEEVPEDESWFCKVCRAAAHPPPRPRAGFFSELILKVETENPKQFTLPADLKNYFRHVAVGTNGEFIDSFEHRPPSKITGRAIGQEDRDGYRLKDKNGKPIICYNCDEAASAVKRRRIISCDFCDQHWHLDCLDPPLSGMPPPTRKWMCPLHADTLVPRKRQLKQTTTQTVDRPYRPNNGDIIILPHQEASTSGDVEEMTVNRVRYQLPEQTVVLDFWHRVTGQKVAPGSSKKSSKPRAPRKRSAGYDSGDLSSLSELTSSDESESEANGARSRKGETSPMPPSALDQLALLAEVRYVDLLQSQQAGDANGTSSRDKGKGAIRDLPPALPNSIQRRGPRPSAPLPATGAVKRTSITGASGSTPGATVGSTSMSGTPRSRNGSPSFSPVPRSSELVVETKEDLQALMRIRKLTKAKDTEGDQWRSTLFGFLEGEPILPKLGFIKGDSTPWQRPWEQRRGGEKPAPADSNGSPAPSSSFGQAARANAPPAAGQAVAADPPPPQGDQSGTSRSAAQPAGTLTETSGDVRMAEPSTAGIAPPASNEDSDLPFSLPASARPAEPARDKTVKVETATAAEPVGSFYDGREEEGEEEQQDHNYD